jgi:hypothetical protein
MGREHGAGACVLAFGGLDCTAVARQGCYAGAAYVACRGDEAGVQDYRDLCLALAFELEAFPDYRDTFTNNFEIGEFFVTKAIYSVCQTSIMLNCKLD